MHRRAAGESIQAGQRAEPGSPEQRGLRGHGPREKRGGWDEAGQAWAKARLGWGVTLPDSCILGQSRGGLCRLAGAAFGQYCTHRDPAPCCQRSHSTAVARGQPCQESLQPQAWAHHTNAPRIRQISSTSDPQTGVQPEKGGSGVCHPPAPGQREQRDVASELLLPNELLLFSTAVDKSN